MKQYTHNNIRPGLFALANIFFAIFLVFNVYSVKADDAVYSTIGGTWEKVNDTTYTMDKDGDGKTDVTLIQDGDEWRYIFNVADDSSLYYGWEENTPDGYEVENGYGTRNNPSISLQYAHTPNIDNDGVQNGDYEGGLDTNQVITVPGANDVNMVLTCNLADGDYIVVWNGNHPEYSAVDNVEQGMKIEGEKHNTPFSFTSTETITIGFHSEQDGKKGYGYYAVINGNNNKNGLSATNVSTDEEPLETGSLQITKKLVVNNKESLNDDIFKFNIVLSSDDQNISEILNVKKTYGDVVIENGKGSFYLSPGKSVLMSGIPSGTVYKIEEENNNNYDIKFIGSGAKNNFISSKIESNKINIIECINTINKESLQTQSLTIKKQLKNSTSTDSFSFHASFENLEKNTEYTYKNRESENTFTSDDYGNADVSFALADNENIIFESLPVGCKYKVTEDASNYFASYEITDAVNVIQQKQNNDKENQSLSTGKETIDKDEDAVVTFTNTEKEAETPGTETTKIHVKKIWNDNNSDIRPDNITVYLMQDENVIKNITLNDDNKWQADIDGLEVYQEDGKTKYEYTVSEAAVNGYTAEITENDGSFTITNTSVETGNLKISKTVKGDGADKTKAFKFTIILSKDNNPISGVYNLDSASGSKPGTIVFDEKGKSSFELKHGESIVITGLPINAKYTVVENSSNEYEPSDGGKYSGTIGDTSDINVVNTYKEKYDLSVTKTVKGNQGDKSKNFDFTLKLTGSNIPDSIEYILNGNAKSAAVDNGNVNFQLSHGEKIIFKNLPAGISYEVVEDGAEEDGYKVSSKNASGIIKADINAEFINTKNVGIPTAAMTNTPAMICMIIIAFTVFITFITMIYVKYKKKNSKKKR